MVLEYLTPDILAILIGFVITIITAIAGHRAKIVSDNKKEITEFAIMAFEVLKDRKIDQAEQEILVKNAAKILGKSTDEDEL